MVPYKRLRLSLLAVLISIPARSALAQVSVCKTSNCAVGAPGAPVLPAECQNLASPRIFEVQMLDSTLRYSIPSPRLEGKNTVAAPWDYQCIEWHKIGTLAPWHSATDDDTGNACNLSTLCTTTNAYPNPCSFETGNVNTTGGPPVLEWSTCHYRDIAPATIHFQCRLHGSLGMTGNLTVVPPIQLSVAKSGAAVNLSWTGGSAAGPWEVFRSPQPSMPAASTTNLTAAGITSRNFSDTPGTGSLFAYMVREHN